AWTWTCLGPRKTTAKNGTGIRARPPYKSHRWKRGGSVVTASQNAHRKIRLITDALDERTRAAQQINLIVSRVTEDLGGADRLSEIEKHLITSFAAAAILQSHQLAELLRGIEIDVHEFASVTAAMMRSAKRLGTDRRPREITPDPLDYARTHYDED